MNYDEPTARYYAAYRPPLHGQLLEHCLHGRYASGLDVGCGTGHSARALRRFCDRVTGTDPSAAMLELAPKSPGIDYRLQRGRRLDFPDKSFDVVTFAGSLCYAKSQLLLDEITRVGRPGATVVVYDFTAPLHDYCHELLGIAVADRKDDGYDPAVTFSGLEESAIRKISSQTATLNVRVDAAELASLFLSEAALRPVLDARFGAAELPESLAQALSERLDEGASGRDLEFTTYTTVYHVLRRG
ncbi:class I SAM-dependent methyltransferase [Neolewinella litorea]|uniref:Class I SAM-dependent methyltransferase n=1 Tax=Neolewinella litorea TaxID=2562452 RepID=A0A4V3XLU2_9BACT|nr:class I SAM-dependent methyltransferase [Neolewinella litorea]THH42033.1 class I SAM-dependent methyltransferase [Neolewinella litorea]